MPLIYSYTLKLTSMKKKHYLPLLYGCLVIITAALIHSEYQTRGRVAGISTQAEQYTIPDLGIAFTPPETMQLMHTVTEKQTELGKASVVYFSSAEINALVKQEAGSTEVCSLSHAPLGTFTLLPGYPANSSGKLPDNAKRIGTKYLFYSPPTPCTDNQIIADAILTQQLFVSNSINTVQSLDGTPVVAAQQGTISGPVTFPPNQPTPKTFHVCAVNTATMENFCNGNEYVQVPADNSKYLYILSVPTGNYQVYATTAVNPRDPNAFRAYYSAYIQCGQHDTCTDHTPISVEVKNNETIENINPGDWTYLGDEQIISMLNEGYKKEARA